MRFFPFTGMSAFGSLFFFLGRESSVLLGFNPIQNLNCGALLPCYGWCQGNAWRFTDIRDVFLLHYFYLHIFVC